MADRRTYTRREVIKLGGMGILAASLGGSCAWKTSSISGPYREFNKVIVSEDRVIREVVGLRPYRPSGFVVRYERLGDKDIVHNYGHGGGGISLCWGTSHMAMEKASKLKHRECAVIGCGVVGLTTATIMQRKGYKVTIYAKDLPPETTSNVGAGKWTPLAAYNQDLITAEFYQDFLRATRLSYNYYQELVGSDYGIRWTQNYIFDDDPIELSDSFTDLAYTYRDVHDIAQNEHPFDKQYCLTHTNLQVETPIFLNALMRDFRIAGGNIVVREFIDLTQLKVLNEPLIMNCTGLGSHQLFDDKELIPAKGQLTILIPQPEVDYTTAVRGDGLYMVPRQDGIILGGSWEEGEWSLTPNPIQSKRILEGHAEFFGTERELMA